MTSPLTSSFPLSLAKIRWFIFVVAGILLVTFVVLMGALRLALPYLSDYEKDIEEYLSQKLERTVLVEKIDADWRWLSPRLKLENVYIKKKNEKLLLVQIDEISFEFGVFHNLFNFSFEPTVITLSGAHIYAKRDKQGLFYLQSVPVNIDLGSASGEETDFSRQVLQQLTNKEIRLEDIKVQWADEVYSNDQHVFEKVDSIFKIGENQYQLLVDIKKPGKLAKSILFKADIEREADEHQRRSNFYFKAKDLNSFAVRNYLSDAGVVIDTIANAEIWLSLEGSELRSLAGNFSSSNLKLNSVAKRHKVNWLADDFNAEFTLQKNNNEWRLVFDNLNMRLNQSNWEDVYFSLRLNPETKSLNLHCDYLNLDDLVRLALTLPIENSIKKTISGYNPTGVLRKTNLVIDNWSDIDNWILNTEFSSLGLNLEENNIKLFGLDGELALEKDKGLIDIDSKDVSFSSEYFNQQLIISSLKAVVGFNKINEAYVMESDKISAVIDNVVFDARLRFQHAEKDHLDLQIESPAATAAWMNRHQTDFFFSPGVVKWLNDALLEAEFENIKLAYHGELDAFPFSANEGVFQSSFDFKNSVLKYQSDWPIIDKLNGHFSIDQDNITISISDGFIYNSKIETATTNINLTGESHVLINGVIDTDNEDLDRFFKTSPLKQEYLKLVEPVKLKASVKTRLNIDVPLNDEVVNVSGEASLKDALLVVKKPYYEIDKINGVVAFDNAFVSSKKLSGVFKDSPVSASIKTKSFKATEKTIISADFSSGLKALLPFDVQLSHLYKQATDWELELEIMHGSVNMVPDFSVNLKSDLTNMALLLPAPLNKPASQAVNFNVYYKQFKHSSELMVQSDEKINMHLRWNDNVTGVTSDIRLQDGAIQQLKPGINVSANIDHVDIKQWQALLTPFVSNKKQSREPAPFHNIKLVADSLQYDDLLLKSATVNAVQIDRQWQIDVAAAGLKANARLSNELSKDRPLYIDFEKFELSSILIEKDDEDITASVISPVDLPPLKISGKNLHYKDYFFEQARLETSRSRYGMTVHALDLQSKNLSLNIKGNWFVKPEDKDHSSFRVEMASNNVGKMLSSFKFTESMKDGEGKAVIDWQWAASPFDFDWNLVSGNMQLDITDGQFVDIEPGAGRLLGMFSLSSLPKRFMLDFSDTFTKGFEFNELTSKANFLDGNLYTSKTVIDGSSADIYFNGRVGLANRDYDTIMSVVPRISSGVSGWLAVLQGAAVGLTAYIGQKILGVDEAAKNQYHISGSWSEPEIKKIENDAEKSQTTEAETEESEE